jgi:hypothetical protein
MPRLLISRLYHTGRSATGALVDVEIESELRRHPDEPATLERVRRHHGRMGSEYGGYYCLRTRERVAQHRHDEPGVVLTYRKYEIVEE